MRYLILILGLIAICGLTPNQRTVTLQHEGRSPSTAINIGGGYFMGAGHCADHGVTLSIDGNVLDLKDYNYDDSDWAIWYNGQYRNDPEVGTAPIVPGETCWFWRNDKSYPVVFYDQDSDGDWVYYGQPPIVGVSGTGVFNANDKLVAIIVARVGIGGLYRWAPQGVATPVLGLVERDNPVTKPPAAQRGG